MTSRDDLTLRIRPARPADEGALQRIDLATLSPENNPGPLPPPDDVPLLAPGPKTLHVLVADLDGTVAGYAKLGRFHTLPSNAHVLELTGLAVDPAHQGRGLGRRLLEAAIAEARAQGARRLRLRVLGSNGSARRLYESCGSPWRAGFPSSSGSRDATSTTTSWAWICGRGD